MTGVAARRPAVAAPVLALIACAWTLAVVVSVTGTADTFHHHGLGEHSLGLGLGLFVVAWPVHVIAMMLPSSLPMLAHLERVAAGQPRFTSARAAFLSAYLAVWTVFGLAALAADLVVHRAVERLPALADRPWLLGASVFVGAGLFQFTSLKDRCLRECRHPGAFLTRYYRRGAAGAFSLGLRHGIFCLGCCWALMLMMFAVGIANFPAMALLALVMIYEKTGRHGERAARWAGSALVSLGVLMLAVPSALPAFVVGG